jgi:hypothetical protein
MLLLAKIYADYGGKSRKPHRQFEQGHDDSTREKSRARLKAVFTCICIR